MKKINVFLAEDSFLIRNLLTSSFKKMDNIDLIDTASDGEEAIEKLKTLNIDLIILDIVMPKLDGLETLKKLRLTDKKTPVIMYSSLTTDSSAWHTMEALTLGATDFCQKPVGFGGKSLSADDSIAMLAEKITNIVTTQRKSRSIASPMSKTSSDIKSNNYDLIVIGSSTGGPEALKTVLSGLAGPLPPILITQHMPAKFTTLLAKTLNTQPNITVQEGEIGQIISPGNAYLAPGEFHMTLTKPKINQFTIDLNQSVQVNSCRPSVDVMLESVAKIYPGKILLIVLTGMGQDGLDGCKLLKEKGNTTVIIQNKETSTVWGMPAAIHDAKLYDNCLPLLEIKNLLYRLSCQKQ